MHDCINCGCACYCHGDIDDCQVETIEYAYEHCVGCGCSEDPDAFEDDDYIDEPAPPNVSSKEPAEQRAKKDEKTGSGP